MRHFIVLACAAMALLPSLPAAARPVELTAVCFVPGEDCTGLIIQAISTATQSIRVQAYEFTSHPIAEALIAARQRGVDVQIILDARESVKKYSAAPLVADAGIKTLVDHIPGIAHNKIIIIDGTKVLTGSFNYTASAQQRNVENVLEIDDLHLAADYTENWNSRLSHSTTYIQR